jgi:ribosome-associated toxin RatA of RatAB toxin-antitoxin module
MPKIKKSAIAFHPKKKIFMLVDKIENYPNFLQWCESTKILKRDKKITTATIEIFFKGIRQSFTTKNTKKENDLMIIELVDGPFKKLTGQWFFKKLSDNSCQIELTLEYEFSNKILDKLISPVFNVIANTFIDEFIKEANKFSK